MLETKPQTGLWSPSCVQHGYTDSSAFNDPRYKVPGLTGKSIPETIAEFLAHPEKPPVVVDNVDWPWNEGCSGMEGIGGLRGEIFQE
jgi:hypothetical protein